MPRPRPLVPAYSLDRATHRAYVLLPEGKKYLGKYDTPESRAAYAKIVAELLANGRPSEPRQAGAEITVSTIISLWINHARKWYGVDAGDCVGRRPAGELGNYWDPLSELRRLFGDSPAVKFGPRQFKAVRAELARDRQVTDPLTGDVSTRRGMTRVSLNRTMSRIRHVFAWAVEEEWIPGEVLYRLRAVRGLAAGRGEARESEPVAPAAEADVRAVLPLLNRHLAAMLELQLVTGMRPGEVCAMRWCDVDTTRNPWVYQPPHHKTAHKGIKRIIPLGRRAREILGEFVSTKLGPDAFVFSPAEAEAERNARRKAANPNPRTPAQIRRAEAAAARQRQRPPGMRYETRSYRRAVDRACAVAFGMPPELKPKAEETAEERKQRQAQASAWMRENKFRPNQLRHTAATAVRRRFGLEAAQLVLGHTSRKTTEIYAEPDFSIAERVAEEIG